MQNDRKNSTGAIVLGVGVLFIILGVFRGEAAAVLTKAVTICLECIGIG